MAATVPTIEPTSFTCGDTVAFTVSPADYPPSEGWTASYILLLPTKRASLVVTDDDVSTFTVTLSAGALDGITVQLEARLIGTVAGSGLYAGERHTIYDGGITIRPNPAESTLDSMRSNAEIELAEVTAAIHALTTLNMSAYSIGTRSYTKQDLPKYWGRQAVLEARVRAEKGLGFRQRRVAFVNG